MEDEETLSHTCLRVVHSCEVVLVPVGGCDKEEADVVCGRTDGVEREADMEVPSASEDSPPGVCTMRERECLNFNLNISTKCQSAEFLNFFSTFPSNRQILIFKPFPPKSSLSSLSCLSDCLYAMVASVDL